MKPWFDISSAIDDRIPPGHMAVSSGGRWRVFHLTGERAAEVDVVLFPTEAERVARSDRAQHLKRAEDNNR